MENNVLHTIDTGERVSSAYADIYFNESYCDKIVATPEVDLEPKKISIEGQLSDEWTSPSDLLIDVIELKPPFTSKITRGKTHEGILAIGDQVLQNELIKFSNELNALIHENHAAWESILEHEKQTISTKIHELYTNLLQKKNKTMVKEITSFYEKSLQELEDHLRSEVEKVTTSVHARVTNNLNIEINDKLKKEKNILEKTLKTKYKAEEEKVKKYYKLLLQNELHRNNTMVRNAISERNEALKAFFQQLEMENTTNTMYVMSTERKKCKIKKFLLQNIHDTDISKKYQKIKERQIIIDAYNEDEVHISDINKEWEEKIQQILKLFLKFISFSFKLLPEQITFLLDFEKMVVLQLNEMIKKPQKVPLILVDKENLDNTFKFHDIEPNESVCDTEPIVVTGNLEDPTPPYYGSRETLPSDVDLPTIRLQRQFLYAKCHEFDKIKNLLDSQICKCSEHNEASPKSESEESLEPYTTTASESSHEPLLVNDIKRLNLCPIRKCSHWAKRYTSLFPDSFLEFSEDNYKLVDCILGSVPSKIIIPELINIKSHICAKLPFATTTERYHTVETQYSSQENVYVPDIECECVDNYISMKQGESPKLKESEDKALNTILMLRRHSIQRLLHKHTELLKIFTDESYDFVM